MRSGSRRMAPRRKNSRPRSIASSRNSTTRSRPPSCSRNSSPAGSAARNDAFRERETVFGDIAGARVPDPIVVFVFDAVLDGLPQRPQPERLAYDEPVQRQRKHQRVGGRPVSRAATPLLLSQRLVLVASIA